jgi:hypothetical protein
MFDKISLPYTCFSRLTRAVQTHAFKAYEVCRKADAPESVEQIALLRAINPEILDKVALFLTRKEMRISAAIEEGNWLSRLIRKSAFKETDALQQLRIFIVDNRYQPWSNNYVYEWSIFFEWYNQLNFEMQCGVNDAFEVFVGKNIFKFVEEFTAEILAHAKSGQNFYPAPQYNEYTGCHERPEILMHKFSVDTRRIESAREKLRRLKGGKFIESDYSDFYDDGFDMYDRSHKESNEAPLRYPEICLPQSINRGCFSATLKGSLKEIFELQGNKKNDHSCNLSYEDSVIAVFKHINGNISLHEINIPHDIPGILSKEILISEIKLIGHQSGAFNIFRSLLDNELSL